MPRLTRSIPSYRKHRPSGQAVVTLCGRDFYLGPHGTKASKLAYDRMISEWLQNGRQLRREERRDDAGLHCNVICDKQVLSFGTDGLTIVFGYNGSGKRGYGRVLRKSCRARHTDRGPILPNAFVPPPNAPASAEIQFQLDGKPQLPFQWIDGQRHDELLRNVSFLDSSCARVHVGEKNDIAFRPQALSILENLAQTCLAVRDELESQKWQVESKRPIIVTDDRPRAHTVVGGMVRAIHSRTDVAKLRTLATLSESEVAKVHTLREALQHDPAKLAVGKRAQANRADDLADLF
jgi:hypothetical protein